MKLSGAGLRKDAYYRSNVIRVSEGPYGRSRSWTSAKPTNVPSMVELRPFGAHQLSAQSSNAGRAGHSVAAAAAGWAPAMDSIDEDTVRLMDRLTDTFKSADTNGDGVLSRDELRSVLERVGSGTEPVPMQWMTDEDLDQIFQTYDANGDGVISYEEFQALAQDKVFLTKALAEYREAFRSFDTGGNGKISPTELCALFTKLDSPLKEYSKIVDLMAKYDVNNDGKCAPSHASHSNALGAASPGCACGQGRKHHSWMGFPTSVT